MSFMADKRLRFACIVTANKGDTVNLAVCHVVRHKIWMVGRKTWCYVHTLCFIISNHFKRVLSNERLTHSSPSTEL